MLSQTTFMSSNESTVLAGIAHAMALGLGPWMAVEIPDLIEKVGRGWRKVQAAV